MEWNNKTNYMVGLMGYLVEKAFVININAILDQHYDIWVCPKMADHGRVYSSLWAASQPVA